MTDRPVLIGHPFAPTGRGEDVRASFRALQAAGMTPLVRDVYGVPHRDAGYVRELNGHLTNRLSNRINIYFLNGDEIERALAHLGPDTTNGALKIAFPAWELASYPAHWASLLDRFDEIWAASKFTQEALVKSVVRPILYMPLASEVALSSYLGRRHFGIPESAFTFLFMFDFTSYVQRKNPYAVLDAFERYVQKHPFHDVCLVLKLNNAGERAKDHEQLKLRLKSIAGRVVVIDGTRTDNETKNLVRNCDCFVSLHRSEGFGRGLSEAMFLGKPVIATAYSANMDFMTPATGCLVDYRLIPVGLDEYPGSGGQVWADADIGQTVAWMERLVADRALGRAIGEKASQAIRTHFGYRAVGVTYIKRLEEIGARQFNS